MQAMQAREGAVNGWAVVAIVCAAMAAAAVPGIIHYARAAAKWRREALSYAKDLGHETIREAKDCLICDL
jgi:hypothetical protein